MNAAVFLLGLICIVLIPGADSDEIACPRQVTGAEYGEVSFQCFYSDIPKANKYSRKFCCLQGSRPGRCKHTIVSDNGYVSARFLERIQLEDSKDTSVFTVTITGLNKADTGTYICGLGQDDNGIKGVLSLSVLEADTKISEDAVLLYAQLRSSVLFQCNYNEQDAGQRKFLCKITKNGCLDIIDSTGRTDSSYEGRVTADVTAGTFTVKMAQVRNLDAAYYTCGSDNPEESKDLPNYDLRINEETDIPQGSHLLTPRLGGSLSAQCNYNPKKSYTEKFWCKLKDGVCNPIVKTDGYVVSTHEGRVLIHDNSTSGLMQVLMNNISSNDEGWYWCVLTGEKHDQTSAVQVRISKEDMPGLSGNKFVQVPAGDPVKITCSYPCRLRTAEKYWCRWRNKCEPMSNVEDTQDSQLVTCQTEELVLTIRSVSHKDSGFYWCGVKEGNRYGESIASHLIVVEPSRDVSNTNVRANPAGGSRNAQVIVTPSSPDNNKSGTITAAVVSVCAAVLVVCAVILFIRLRRRKNSDLVSIGSYRTNISMSDLDRNIGKENPTVTDLQETNISRFEDSPKTKKKGSQENLDYSCFLINNVGNPNEQVVE